MPVIYNQYFLDVNKWKKEQFKAARVEALIRRMEEELRKRRAEIIKDPFKPIREAAEQVQNAFRELAEKILKDLQPVMDSLNCFMTKHKCPKLKPENKSEELHIVNPVFEKYDNFKNPFKGRYS